MRKITIASVQDGSKIEVESSARTLTELKGEYPEIKVKTSASNAFLKNTRKDISDTDALPEEDVIIYLYVDKTRSGETEYDPAIVEFIESLSDSQKLEAREILDAMSPEIDEIVEVAIS